MSAANPEPPDDLAVAADLITQAEFVSILDESHDDPQFFFDYVLRVKKTRKWQREMNEEIKRRLEAGERHIQVHVRAAHGAGKGFYSAGLCIWWQATRPGARTLTTAPTWRDVEQLLWAEIRSLYNGSLLKIFNIGRILQTEWKTGEGGRRPDPNWFATGAAADNPANLEGQHSLIAACRIVDEAKAVPDEVFVATEGLLSSMETLDVWISTPAARIGKFYERDVNGGPELIRRVVTIDDLIADDVPGALRWKKQALIEYGGEDNFEYQSRAMGNYIDNAEGMLFPYSWIERAMLTDAERVAQSLPVWHVTGHATYGYDVAGSVAGDENAVAPVRGPDSLMRYEVDALKHWHELDTMVSKDRVIEMAYTGRPRCVRGDVQGLGKAVMDAIVREVSERNLNFYVEEYRSANPAEDPERFLNAKAENAWGMRLALEQDRIRLPKSATLRKQMAQIMYEVKNGKIRILDPEDSPDHWDAVLIGIGAMFRSFTPADIYGDGASPWAATNEKLQAWTRRV